MNVAADTATSTGISSSNPNSKISIPIPIRIPIPTITIYFLRGKGSDMSNLHIDGRAGKWQGLHERTLLRGKIPTTTTLTLATHTGSRKRERDGEGRGGESADAIMKEEGVVTESAATATTTTCTTLYVRILDVFSSTSPPPYPTHIIVSNQNGIVSAAVIASALGFFSSSTSNHIHAAAVQAMHAFFKRHAIQVVKRSWLDRGHAFCYPPITPPTRTELHPDFLYAYYDTFPAIFTSMPLYSSPIVVDAAASPRNVRPRTTHLNKNRSSIDHSLPEVTISSSSSSSSLTLANLNHELSQIFRDLADQYQNAPLDPHDEFRALSFLTTAQRLAKLPVALTSSSSAAEILVHLGKTKTSSSSSSSSTTMRIVREYLDSGTCARLEALRNDPYRQRVRAFLSIWGVGPIRARELADAVETMEELRAAVATGTIQLHRNQWIGLHCYDDLLHEMPRSEVQAIFGIVSEAIRQRYPLAEIHLMGSYRRNLKPTCGDVDVLITHPDYPTFVPAHGLGMIVDDLCRAGHVAYHLTCIAGMQPEDFETVPEPDQKFFHHRQDPPHQRLHSATGQHHESQSSSSSSSTYMGIFHSPVVDEKKSRARRFLRRVDIKWYAHDERVFASLYFTGNAYFNRSMRLYASRSHNMTLTDHGLYESGTNHRVIFNSTATTSACSTTNNNNNNSSSKDRIVPAWVPPSEQSVFDKLGILYKEPCQRDGYDAVHAMDGTMFELTTLSKEEKDREVEHRQRVH